MKRTLTIALALICCMAAEAQLRTIKPHYVFKVPNISADTYYGEFYDDENPLYWDLYSGDPSWYDSASIDNIAASSALRSQGSASYDVENIADFNHETAWVEGVKGNGVGQWIEFQGVRGNQITTIKILNGYVKSDKAWSENSRVRLLKVYCNGEPLCILELKNSRSLQAFDVETLLEDSASYGVNTFRFEILDVYPGTKYQDTVISEIYFDGYFG